MNTVASSTKGGDAPEYIYTVIQRPLFTEKTSRMGEASNQYGFEVRSDANKRAIKQAVERMFDVEVENVSTLNVKAEVRRTMRGYVRKQGYKKAYVRLKAGQTIDLAPN